VDTNTSNISTMMIGGQEIEVVDRWLPQNILKYYPENPRIYSIVYSGEGELSQFEIQERLVAKDHVKQLYQSIKANGGLIDPLIVLDGEFTVLEGNSRLAAYSILVGENAIKWGRIKCRMLPQNIDEKLIFNLLGQYHIIGRKDWAPFEQAGYLWRRKQHYNATIHGMAKEMGISEGKVRSLIKVYSFMHDSNDLDVQKWSYYDELLKIPASKKSEFPEFDQIVASKIKAGEIPKAIDVREKVKSIVTLPGKHRKKLVKRFLTGKNNLEICYESAQARGAGNVILKKLTSFKEYILDPDIESIIFDMERAQKKKCVYEIKKISQATTRIQKKEQGR
jgi:hypothetical protein